MTEHFHAVVIDRMNPLMVAVRPSTPIDTAPEARQIVAEALRHAAKDAPPEMRADLDARIAEVEATGDDYKDGFMYAIGSRLTGAYLCDGDNPSECTEVIQEVIPLLVQEAEGKSEGCDCPIHRAARQRSDDSQTGMYL